MHFLIIFRVIGILLILFGSSMLPPVLVAFWYGEQPLHLIFLENAAYCFSIGGLLWLICHHKQQQKQELKTRDGFLTVVLCWAVIPIFGAFPFLMIETLRLSLVDAFFESVSGLTTTGASILSDHLETLPYALRYYRQQLQFLGGMGIVVLAIAILPMLGIGGMQLYRAETPGPIKDSKLTPRITETAKALWIVYLGLMIVCSLAYWAAGMTWFEAIGESFGTISTGGFSVHKDSFAYYGNPLVEWIGSVFMILGATNFGLHFLAVQHQSLFGYWNDPEFRAFIVILVSATLMGMATLYLYDIYQQPLTNFSMSWFHVVSMATTTGFTNTEIGQWPHFLLILLMYIGLIGGCAASTSGGIKVMRLLLIYKQSAREMTRLIHPKAVLPIKFGTKILPEHLIDVMWGFIAAFIAFSAFMVLLLVATGENFGDAFGIFIGCFANIGVSSGGTGVIQFDQLSTTTKWLAIFTMLAGRLEIFTLLMLFMPAFWKR